MLKINYSFMMKDFLSDRGLSPQDIEGLESQVKRAHERIKKREFPELEFLDLPFQDTEEIERIAGWIREKARYFVILGIGGSALGPKVILDTLCKTNEPHVFIYDNVDPRTIEKILRHVRPEETVVNVITKSGTTVETVAGFMIMWEAFKKAGLEPQEHFVITTDPEKGPLRRISQEYGLKSLSIPQGVVGRYSVLSPVGLLLASVIGADCKGLLEGAAEIMKDCSRESVKENPAYLFGSLLYLMDIRFSRRINILMPYADSLRSFSEWFSQLWAESLGKEGRGLMPYPSIGATDQHSQLQLWIEGPDDKVVIFLRIEDYGVDIEIPHIFSEIKEFSFLSGHTLSELIKAEQEATSISLMKAKRPSMTITVPAIDAFYLGGLFQFFEIATAFTGMLYGINPFNQPAVEEGKIFTQAMMGRAGLEEKLEEVLSLRQKIGLYSVVK